MTISFHHHFREGDHVVNLVIDKLAEMGFKNLTIAPSSLSDVHAPLIEHIKNGVITKINTSGLRGKLADAVSHGLMEEPVLFRSHGGRAAAIKDGDLKIDVAFLGASSCDTMGNANGYSRDGDEKSVCGSLGYAMVDARYAKKGNNTDGQYCRLSQRALCHSRALRGLYSKGGRGRRRDENQQRGNSLYDQPARPAACRDGGARCRQQRLLQGRAFPCRRAAAEQALRLPDTYATT